MTGSRTQESLAATTATDCDGDIARWAPLVPGRLLHRTRLWLRLMATDESWLALIASELAP